MSRKKNALRQHWVADYVEGETPAEGDYKELARWITEITDASDEEVEAFADYAGDGTPKDEVLSIKEAYDVSGTHDPTDEAQALIAGKKRKLGQGRKIWHKIITADGKDEIVGVATLSAIVAGSGEASGYEAFGCKIAYDEIPTVSNHTPAA